MVVIQSSTDLEFSIKKLPEAVLRKAIKAPPDFNFCPKSLAMERIYVPLLHVILKSTSGKREASISNTEMLIVFAFNTTSFPALAKS